MRFLPTRLLIVSALALATAAHADTVYTLAAAYAAATGPQTTATFDTISTGANNFANESPSFTDNGITFSSPTSTLFVIAPGYYNPAYADDNFLAPQFGSPADSFTVTLPSPSTAVSFNYGGLFGPNTFVVTLSDGTIVPLATTQNMTGTSALDFVGFTTTTPITSFTVVIGPANYSAFDNFSYGAAAITPEPSSLVLLGTGVLGAVHAIRRRLKA